MLLLALNLQGWFQHALYPSLLGILIIASLGVPIPEDLPLIAAGVVLARSPESASWFGVILFSLMGIMSGDTILYSLGRHWGPSVCEHRFVRWLITPRRFRRMQHHFSRWGAWMCFFGRFVVGIRAVMCLTAGATRFAYWRFFLADFTGALLSAPLFVFLGYWFANTLPKLRSYVQWIEWGLLALTVAAIVGTVLYLRSRRRSRHRVPIAKLRQYIRERRSSELCSRPHPHKRRTSKREPAMAGSK